MAYAAQVGLEIHAQLKTATKLFCGCASEFGAPPNSRVCPVCLGLPGALPRLNARAVTLALRVGLALSCRIHGCSVFARKNYFYPDVPKNYQITQYEQPLCTGGYLDVTWEDRPGRGGRAGDAMRSGRIGITRAHLEEDAGKSLHPGPGSGRTRLDYNRAGVPLIEIVSEPLLENGRQAASFMKTLCRILVHLDACDGSLEEGSLRCDANVSVRAASLAVPGTKVEIKNMNSYRAVQEAIDHEVARQADLLGQGQLVRQETRAWDAASGCTVFMRSKERAHDYRYLPEPDLPPLIVTDEEIAAVRRRVPELPAARAARLQSAYGLPEYDASVLTETRALADYFEAVAGAVGDGKLASNWIMTEVLKVLNERRLDITAFSVGPARLAALLGMVRAGRLSGRLAKEIFAAMVETGRDPAAIISEQGLRLTADPEQLAGVVREVLAQHPREVEQYRAGKSALFGYFMGEVMKATQGSAHPGVARDLLQAELERSS